MKIAKIIITVVSIGVLVWLEYHALIETAGVGYKIFATIISLVWCALIVALWAELQGRGYAREAGSILKLGQIVMVSEVCGGAAGNLFPGKMVVFVRLLKKKETILIDYASPNGATLVAGWNYYWNGRELVDCKK